LSELLIELGYEVAADEVERGRREPGTQIFVAEDHDHVVGLLSMHTRRHFQRAALVSSIDALVVAVSHRENGVGRALVQAACDAASERVRRSLT
jgi:predicted N-acetyltransferase YhbS